MKFADRLLMQHRIKGHQLIDIDGLELQFGGNPLDRLSGNVPESLLDGVQQHQRGAAFFWIMGDQLVGLRLQDRGHDEIRLTQQRIWNRLGRVNLVHRSHSPITKSSDPRIATTSLTMWPGNSRGKMVSDVVAILGSLDFVM